jgi:hypothetical protein
VPSSAAGSTSGDVLMVNGDPNNGLMDLRQLHPNLYFSVMFYACWAILLGVNFLVFTPTYLIFSLPNQLWGSVLLGIGVSELVFLNIRQVLKFVRLSMAASISLCGILAVGTCQPFAEGVGSLQLPIMYAFLAAFQFPLLIEPPVNPWTKR